MPVSDEAELTITGNLLDGATFQGSRIIRVIDPGQRKGTLKEEGEPQKKSQKGK